MHTVPWVRPKSRVFHKCSVGLAPLSSVQPYLISRSPFPVCIISQKESDRNKNIKEKVLKKYDPMIRQSRIFNCLVDSIVLFGQEGGGKKGWGGCWGNTSELEALISQLVACACVGQWIYEAAWLPFPAGSCLGSGVYLGSSGMLYKQL